MNRLHVPTFLSALTCIGLWVLVILCAGGPHYYPSPLFWPAFAAALFWTFLHTEMVGAHQ